ncbi:CBS domain-containing protein [Halobacterium salinarum]|uniref:site-2 protease family protein n=1 Tax=Halobacterium salinarum TaxID=2242 RepID=UPI001F3DE831|nr:site-2 protease family protein [Halobacterium salinarum]MCF2208179.1 CBS domain-containing protein [Halobacterium salinarum]MCF2242064.1 CBS domain-containing protein [Halobacterium salinarum]
MRGFRIGRVFGIPIKLDVTFLLVLPVFAYLIGTQLEVWVSTLNGAPFAAGLDATALTAGSVRWVLGAAAAVGLFVGVVLHELGHSVVAMRYDFTIDAITLWVLGGVASLTDQPEEWDQELCIALAGPAVSVALAAVAYGVLVVLPSSLDTVRFVFGYLALMNLALAAFNLLPGFPMDGGRVLRALLARTRTFARATKIAAEVGKLFAFVLGIAGLLSFNVILIGVAFFIYIGAAGEAQRTAMNAAFEGVTVADVMTPASDVHTVAATASVADLMDSMLEHRHTGYPVFRDATAVGMVTLDDARSVRAVERDAMRVADVMSDDVYTIPGSADATDALDALQEHSVGRLLVVDADGEMVGLITRSDLMDAFGIIQSTGAAVSRESLDLPSRP